MLDRSTCSYRHLDIAAPYEQYSAGAAAERAALGSLFDVADHSGHHNLARLHLAGVVARSVVAADKQMLHRAERKA